MVGNSPRVRRKLVEGNGSLPGWRKGVRQKKTETRWKIVGVAEKLAGNDVVGSRRSSLGDSSKGSGTCWEITEKRSKDSPQECRRLSDWWELGLDYLDWSLSVVIIES
ncbi:hypothetical protein GW17_00042756 [Ensete ventricosum]|nr:hypothetical protein GW17_00042756 [Ensete ventricosum]